MKNKHPLSAVALQFGMQISTEDDVAVRLLLIHKINGLILHDFEKLVSILYRIDVSEKKINQLLKTFPKEDAGAIIADLMIEREAEKIKSRKTFTRKKTGFTDEELW